MLLPPWARVAARVLADVGQGQNSHGEPSITVASMVPENSDDGGETVAGTISRKEKLRFWDPWCIAYHEKRNEWLASKKCPAWRCPKYHRQIMEHRYKYRGYRCPKCCIHNKRRCNKCRGKAKRWTRATKTYWKLDLLRQEEGRENLKFITFSHEEWNVMIPASMSWVAKDVANQIKVKGMRKFKNWRFRNKYWLSREAKGQLYPEWTLKPVWNGWGFDEVQIHFHIHGVVVSKKIENSDIQVDMKTLRKIPMSTTIQREWGGIVDVRKCKTWNHSDGTKRTSKRFVMGYLVNYINKLEGWNSVKFGF